MDFELDSDQQAIVDGIDAVLAAHVDLDATIALGTEGRSVAKLREALAESGFLDLGLDSDGDWLAATLVVEAIARAGGLVDGGAAVLVAPAVAGRSLAGPIALAVQGEAGAVRFGAEARTALVDCGTEARLLSLEPSEKFAVETNYPWPMGRVRVETDDLNQAESLGEGSGARLRDFWRLAIAAECIGSMQAALDTTVEYVKQRRQFGRAVGSFQAIQHRLAELSVAIEGGRWLVYEAAHRGAQAESAAAAAAHVCASASAVFTETHQLSGAIGYTREHALQLWTMRLPVLRLEMGGTHAHRRALARARWLDTDGE